MYIGGGRKKTQTTTSTNHHHHIPSMYTETCTHKNMLTPVLIRDSLESRQGSNATQHQNILTQISSTVTGTLEEER